MRKILITGGTVLQSPSTYQHQDYHQSHKDTG